MKVKNYIVENYQLLMNFLEEELCKNGISYVRIDNEIHFLDYIIRFYDFELDKNIIMNWGLLKFEHERREKFYQAIDNIFFKNVNEDKNNYSKMFALDCEDMEDLPQPYQTRNKHTQKREANLVNQKLKRYQKK